MFQCVRACAYGWRVCVTDVEDDVVGSGAGKSFSGVSCAFKYFNASSVLLSASDGPEEEDEASLM